MDKKHAFDFVGLLKNQLDAIGRASRAGTDALIRLNLNKALATVRLLENALMYQPIFELTSEEKKVAEDDQFRATKMLYQRIKGSSVGSLRVAKSSVEVFVLLGAERAKELADTSNY